MLYNMTREGGKDFSLGKVHGFSVHSQFSKENLHFSVTNHKEKSTELYSGLNINILILAGRQTISFVCTSQIFLCIVVYLEFMYVMHLHNLTPVAHWGSCSEAKLSLDTLERVMAGLVAGGLTLLFRILPSHQMVPCW